MEDPAGPARRLRVLIADDHPAMRRAMRNALATQPSRFDVAGEAGNGEQATALIARLLPDVALVDLRMPGLDGIEVAAWVARHVPPLPTRVLLLSAFHDDPLVLRALRAGAAGYADKGTSHAELCEAVSAVGAGKFAFTARTLGGAGQGR